MDVLESFEKWTNEAYLPLYIQCGGNEIVLNVFIPLIIMLTVYWTVSLSFLFMDLYGRPHGLVQFKIPDPTPTKYPRLSLSQFRHVAEQVVFNQTVIAVPVIFSVYLLKNFVGYNKDVKLPPIYRIAFDFIVQILAEEVFFYYSHRLLHHPRLYKRFHKRHHEWISPVGASAIYCHPVEHVLSNVLPTFMGSVVARAHVVSLWAWLTFATAYGVIVHSGYHLPLTPTPEFHHFHHLRFNENFGVAGILDWMHGTDKEFRKSKAFTRNKVLFSVKPLHVK